MCGSIFYRNRAKVVQKQTKRTQFVFVIVLSILIFISGPIIARSESSRSGQPEEITWKGSVSQQKKAFVKVVENAAEWQDLWLRAFEQTAPVVDFETYVVACIFLGHSADWLYDINFGTPYLKGDTWIIPYELVELVLELAGPFKASGQYRMKLFRRKTGSAETILERRFPNDSVKIPKSNF